MKPTIHATHHRAVETCGCACVCTLPPPPLPPPLLPPPPPPPLRPPLPQPVVTGRWGAGGGEAPCCGCAKQSGAQREEDTENHEHTVCLSLNSKSFISMTIVVN